MSVLIIAYGVLAILCWRPVAGHLAFWYRDHSDIHSARQKPPTGEHWFYAGIFGGVICVLWPVLLGWLASGKFLPAVGAEREALNIKERDRLKALEAWYENNK